MKYIKLCCVIYFLAACGNDLNLDRVDPSQNANQGSQTEDKVSSQPQDESIQLTDIEKEHMKTIRSDQGRELALLILDSDKQALNMASEERKRTKFAKICLLDSEQELKELAGYGSCCEGSKLTQMGFEQLDSKCWLIDHVRVLNGKFRLFFTFEQDYFAFDHSQYL